MSSLVINSFKNEINTSILKILAVRASLFRRMALVYGFDDPTVSYLYRGGPN